jgi:hypothetical protein
MTVVDSPEAPGITPDELDIDLVHWHWMPDRQQALQFTAQGWALVEALAQFGEYLRPQHLVAHMLGQVINAMVDEDRNARPKSLEAQWRIQDSGLTASVTFEVDALKTVAETCDMELGELQIAIQASVEMSLLKLYAEHSGTQRLH